MKEADLESGGRERENEKEEEKIINCLSFIKAFIAGGILNSKRICCCLLL